ncbi:RNA polymerase sigma factor [Dactylosporangium matsuzakiense]|uniref:DNA-directed RNA polymerase sigma-70 factor n=1 Tax=Dactylosporangium matsuzakiense TaxID=53360 RepID=A0A9W6NSI3_9ACTN|nr:RNA polymerase sigma factor [Dactylosporangium matsuzakiense]UWZ49158.1 RNA polymerase sigma factor [Dactylosporangium matsuzakiense]GLL08395.1 DNA-directed RNA polymerase sigma-70 factor [Dactylosporangium matsuzakiense]
MTPRAEIVTQLTGEVPVDGLPDVGQLFDRYGAELRHYCASRVGAGLAEDIVAETFLIAYQRRDRLHDGPVRAWLYGIASNLLRRHRRTETRALRTLARTGQDPLVPDVADRAIARADASTARRDLAGVLARLPARQRDVLLLYALADLDYDTIARTLGIPLGSVQSALFRARAKLRAALTGGPLRPAPARIMPSAEGEL